VKIKIGDYFSTRKGEVVKIIEFTDNPPWLYMGNNGLSYDGSGSCDPYGDASEFDLIKEVTKETYPEYFL